MHFQDEVLHSHLQNEHIGASGLSILVIISLDVITTSQISLTSRSDSDFKWRLQYSTENWDSHKTKSVPNYGRRDGVTFVFEKHAKFSRRNLNLMYVFIKPNEFDAAHRKKHQSI